MSELKPCPNPECRSHIRGLLTSASVKIVENAFGAKACQCAFCGLVGPAAHVNGWNHEEAWNELPRITERVCEARCRAAFGAGRMDAQEEFKEFCECEYAKNFEG